MTSISSHSIPAIVVTDTAAQLNPSDPTRPRLLLPVNKTGITTLEIQNSRIFLVPQALHNLEQIGRKNAAAAYLASCMKEYKNGSVELLKKLECAVVEAMCCFKQGQQLTKDDNIGYAFLTVANGYAKFLPKAVGIEKELQEQKITMYFNFALEFASNEFLKVDIYFKFAFHYQSQENYEKELAMWIACSKYDAGRAAYNHIGAMYLQGHGVAKDGLTALKWFMKGAEKGDQDAQFNVALIFDNVRLSTQNPQKKNEYKERTIKAYSQIASHVQKDHKYANESRFRACFLTDLNAGGAFAPKNSNKSLAAYKHAVKVDSKNYTAINALALTTFFTTGNIKSTIALVKKAAEAGSALAKDFLKLKTNEERQEKLTQFCKYPDPIYTEDT